jgi:hypothetical protein
MPHSGISAVGTIQQRWNRPSGTSHCFVCLLLISADREAVYASDPRDRHTRAAHTFCWDMVMRYAQAVIDTQIGAPS